MSAYVHWLEEALGKYGLEIQIEDLGGRKVGVI
jgi:hypothetical protein